MKKQTFESETHTAEKIRWKPKNGEKYFYVNFMCEIETMTYQGDKVDLKLIEIGNCYPTPKETELRRQHYLSFKN